MEHWIRAGATARADDVVVTGSEAILSSYADLRKRRARYATEELLDEWELVIVRDGKRTVESAREHDPPPSIWQHIHKV